MTLRRYTGDIIKFDHRRGFGWVRVDNVPLRDVFLHIAAFSKSVGLHEIGPGVKCEFYIEKHDKGLRAVRANIV
jgi:cold shock CspA family protein